MALAKNNKKTSPAKFQTILAASGQDLLDRRSQLMYNGTSAAMEDKITSLKRKRDAIEFEMLNMEDLSVKNRNSLKPGSGDFDPKIWINGMLEKKAQIEIIDIDLNSALELQSEYFTAGAEELV
jgi:hypothetical protein